MRLNIAIPTYNRNANLVRNLEGLLPQLTDACRLFIVDNHSLVPVEESVAPLLAGHPGLDVTFIRNRYNVGAHANILRCFEYADSDWLWILGDDDLVAADAVKVVLEEIAANEDAIFIGFRAREMVERGFRDQAFDTHGVEEFAERIDDPGAVNFMSTSVWHVAKVVGNLHTAYHYAYSMSHTLVLLLTSMGATGVTHFSNRVLIESKTLAPAESRWRYKDFVLGFNTILELPLSPRVRRNLAAKVMAWHPPENVAVYFLAEASRSGSDGFLYRVASARLRQHMPGLVMAARFGLYRLLFISPAWGWKIVQSIVRLAVRLGLKHVQIDEIEKR